jgi:hypothetical protein
MLRPGLAAGLQFGLLGWRLPMLQHWWRVTVPRLLQPVRRPREAELGRRKQLSWGPTWRKLQRTPSGWVQRRSTLPPAC